MILEKHSIRSAKTHWKIISVMGHFHRSFGSCNYTNLKTSTHVTCSLDSRIICLDSLFFKCKADKGGAIFSNTAIEFQCNISTFSNCTALTGPGGAVFYQTLNGHMILDRVCVELSTIESQTNGIAVSFAVPNAGNATLVLSQCAVVKSTGYQYAFDNYHIGPSLFDSLNLSFTQTTIGKTGHGSIAYSKGLSATQFSLFKNNIDQGIYTITVNYNPDYLRDFKTCNFLSNDGNNAFGSNQNCSIVLNSCCFRRTYITEPFLNCQIAISESSFDTTPNIVGESLEFNVIGKINKLGHYYEEKYRCNVGKATRQISPHSKLLFFAALLFK